MLIYSQKSNKFLKIFDYFKNVDYKCVEFQSGNLFMGAIVFHSNNVSFFYLFF